jgi:putative ABC transport system permease protein
MSNGSTSFAEIQEGMRLALQSVLANKFRSFMTIVGVMIGVGAVILVNTIMDGFTAYTYSSVDKIGTNVIYISKWAPGTDFDNLTDEQRRRKNITMDEAYAIREFCPLVQAVSPEKLTHNNYLITCDGREMRLSEEFRGCWPEQPVVTNRDMSHGRFIDDADMSRAAMVCVIGPEVADALFASRADAIDKEIRINGTAFRVIGVQEFIDDFFKISENNLVLIPMTTFYRLYPRADRVYLLVSAASRERMGEALDQITNALRRVRQVKPEEENNFGFETQEAFKNEIRDITLTVQLVATAVAAVGLMVGVIGVMNIMLIAVTQRTREIGIRKAIGAKRKNIIFQFVVEAGTLTALGGIVGIIFGALLGLTVTSILDWKFYLVSLPESILPGGLRGSIPSSLSDTSDFPTPDRALSLLTSS